MDDTEPRPQLTDAQLAEWEVLAAAASPGPWVPVTDNCDCYGGCSHGENGGSEFAYAISTPTHEKWGLSGGDVCKPDEPGDYVHHQRAEISQFTIADLQFTTAARDAVPALIAEVRASRAREAELTAMTRVNTFIGMQVDRDNERVHRRRAEGRIDVLQQRIDKALASLPDSSKYTVGAENALRVVSLLLDDIATARAALSGYAS